MKVLVVVVWVVLTVLLMAAMAEYRKFITTKIGGGIVIAVRVPIKMVGIVILAATGVFTILKAINWYSIFLAVDSTMPLDSSPVYSVFIALLLVPASAICYLYLLTSVFKIVSKEHEEKLRYELQWRRIIRQILEKS